MNFPRLGVQNPQFTNVYEMERNAQANRPFSQLLNTGAKVIPAYIDQQKKEAEAQQLKDATNERNAFISNYGQGFVGGLTSPQSFMPKMTELDPTVANQLMDARKANAPKPVASTALTPEASRQQLRIARDNAMQAAGNQTLSDAERKIAAKESSILALEMSKINPNVQGVYGEINKLYTVPVENANTTQDVTGVAQLTPAPAVGGIGIGLNNLSSEINSTLGAIKYKGDSLNSAVVSLRDKVNNSGLEKSDKDVLLKKIADDAALKGGAPAPINVDKVVDAMMNDSSTKPIPAALTLYTKSKNAYSSANSALASNAVGAAIANFLYALRPEAVNEGDIELAKNSVRDNNKQGMKAVLDKVGLGGFMTTDYASLAKQLGKAANDKLAKARKESINQVVNLNDKLDNAAVEKRASVYFPIPEPVYGSAKTTATKKERRQGTMEDFE